MNKALERIINYTYTFVEAEEIKNFIKEKKLDDVIQKAIDAEKNAMIRSYDDDFENDE
jgi:hypothetical protein